MKHQKRVLAVAFLGLVLVAISFVPKGRVLPLQAAVGTRVSPEQASFNIVAPGVVEPASEERPVGSEVIGILRSVTVEENDIVRANDIVAVVKNDDQTALLAQARAAVSGAGAALIAAEQNYLRVEALESQRNASTSALDAARHSRDFARAELDRYSAMERLAQANLEKTLIRSPIDGVVLKKLVVAGAAVSNQPPTQIAIVGDVSHLRVRAEVDELDVGKLSSGQKVTIRADAFPDFSASGTVLRVNKRLGARQVLTDRATERSDTKVLQTLVTVDGSSPFPVGLRVDVLFTKPVGSNQGLSMP